MAAVFCELGDDSGMRPSGSQGAVLEASRLAACAERRTGLGARRQLAGGGRPSAQSSPPRPRTRADGLSVEEVRKATMDSVRALMMIRAYRMRGHLAADLDPLAAQGAGAAARARSRVLRLHRSRSRPADLHRQGAWGSNRRRSARSCDILKRTYCNTLGVEFMHISDPEQKAWIQERIEGPDKEITFTPEGKIGHLRQAHRRRKASSISSM